MRILCIIIILLTGNIAGAKDYIYYYRQTQLAEEALLNGDFNNALEHYDSAFALYNFKFARDCYIAAQTSYYQKDLQRTQRYLSYCMKAGIRYRCLYKTAILQPFEYTKEGKELQQDTAMLWAAYTNAIDTNLHKEWTRRYDKEQAIKGQKEAYYVVIDDNLNRIMQLLKLGIFPDERFVGISNTISHTARNFFPDNDCEYAARLALPTLLHYPYTYDMLGKQLKQAMLQGYINPRALVEVFIFSKWRICPYRKEVPGGIALIENTGERDVIFNLPFEKQKTDAATANKNRDKWFLPKSGTKYTSDELFKKFGITIAIGDWQAD
jgi:hypothetical protein